MVAHAMLVALDNNSNTKLEQVEGENSKSSWKLQWSQHNQTFIIKKQCVLKNSSQRSNVMYMVHLNSVLKGKVLTILQPWCKSAVL